MFSKTPDQSSKKNNNCKKKFSHGGPMLRICPMVTAIHMLVCIPFSNLQVVTVNIQVMEEWNDIQCITVGECNLSNR